MIIFSFIAIGIIAMVSGWLATHNKRIVLKRAIRKQELENARWLHRIQNNDKCINT